MQLRLARLCLDCEEVYDAPQCPSCASETFAFVTRWIPPAERRTGARPPEPIRPPASGKPSPGKMIGYGVVGLGIMGLARWFALGRKRIEDSAMSKQIGELK